MKKATPIERIITRDGTVVKYERERVANAVFKATVASGSPDRKLAESAAGRVERILVRTYGRSATPSVEDIQDIVENALMESGHTKVARDYIIYRHRRAELRAARAQPFEMSDIIPYRKIYEVLLWNLNHRCDSVQGLNELIRGGKFPALVRDCEARYRAEVDRAAEQILERAGPHADGGRAGKMRIAIVAGPSASGKTTTTIKIAERLKRHGLRLKAITVDNYFFDLERNPRDEFGDYDYEAPQAIDLKLLNRHLEALLAGRTIRTPQYDFKTGKRRLDVNELRLEKNEILLIDSLHGLHKWMTRDIPHECKFKLYIETLGQFRSQKGDFMRWADNRLLRRMIRDAQHRNSQPIQTIMHWHYVRTSELSHIIPFINTADCVINTAMPYELPVLKSKLFDFFPKAIREFKGSPRQRDAFIRAKRVYDFLKPLESVADTGCIPKTALLREFIGGSSYRY